MCIIYLQTKKDRKGQSDSKIMRFTTLFPSILGLRGRQWIFSLRRNPTDPCDPCDHYRPVKTMDWKASSDEANKPQRLMRIVAVLGWLDSKVEILKLGQHTRMVTSRNWCQGFVQRKYPENVMSNGVSCKVSRSTNSRTHKTETLKI